MITEIYENLFKPASDDDVATRRGPQRFKVGDVVKIRNTKENRKYSFGSLQAGEIGTVMEIYWTITVGQWWDYLVKSEDGRSGSVPEDVLVLVK